MERGSPERPLLIGMVHLPALPGAPRFAGDLREVVRAAVADARSLAEGGIDSLLVENFGDVPFFPERVPAWTVASLTRCVLAVREAVDLPVGVNVLRNDAEAALGIAAATGAAFVRVNVHAHAMLTDQGLIQGRAQETLRTRRALGLEVGIAADVRVKHARPLAPCPIEEEAADVVKRGLADVVVVSGSGTGHAPRPETIAAVVGAVRVPVWLGSGLTEENAGELLPGCSGAIVGTSLHRDGDVSAPIDGERVRRVVAACRSR